MGNLNANISGIQNTMKSILEQSSVQPNKNVNMPTLGNPEIKGSAFSDTVKAIDNYLSNVDDLQQSSDMSITDLLSGKNEDITSVVSAVTKADLSFKLLVGVRNKLIEAYKQTMNMPL